jgi:mono/diheme cytochrome c family protein
MKRVLKWIGIGIAGLLGLLVLAFAGLAVYANVKFHQVVERPVYEITADTSPAGIARGEYLVRDVVGCQDCHGPAVPEGEKQARDAPLSGQAEEVSLGPISALFAAPNLTPDEATGLGSWTDGEIARAIREGLDKDGVSLAIMPSSAFHGLSDADVAAMVGYLRSLEPVANEIPDVEANIVGKIVLTAGLFEPPNPTEPITKPVFAPSLGTAEYGQYIVNSLMFCVRCHGENLAGGPLPMAAPDTPPAANLTPAGELAGWTAEQFITAVRQGTTPAGRQLHEAMPRFAHVSDEDLQAVFLYLQSLPAAQAKQ